MDGRAFLLSADTMVRGQEESDWRTAAGRAYYAGLHEASATLARWGIFRPQGESLHQFVRRRFSFPQHADLLHVGKILDQLANLRNQADYQLMRAGNFASSLVAPQAIQDCRAADADPARRAAATAAIQAAFPP